MAGSSHFAHMLSAAGAFAGLDAAALEALYRVAALKALAKGEIAASAGSPVDELCIVVSGRLVLSVKGKAVLELGRGQVLEEEAFFTRAPAEATAEALRESVLLTLDWWDFAAACRDAPGLLEACLAAMAAKKDRPPPLPHPRPSRLALCPAGGGQLDSGLQAALLSALEAKAELRLLTGESFGAGLPGAITLGAPEAAHYLQEQEQTFDLTVVVANPADSDFTQEAIEEADEILLIADGRDPVLSAFEHHAFKTRGGDCCRLILADRAVKPGEVSSWLPGRPCRSAHLIDIASPEAMGRLTSMILGGGAAVAASSRGVYAAAILGALEAFEACGVEIGCLSAAGSAVLPAGLVAAGERGADIAPIFGELARGGLWKRAARAETGLFEAAPIDRLLVEALSDLEIAGCERSFVAVSLSLSTGKAELHKSGRLHGAVRANLAPPGILPPLVTEGGDILVSGEGQGEALVEAARFLTPSPAILLRAKAPPLGGSETSYRHLSHGGHFRIAPFQAQAELDRRVRLETILSSAADMAPAPPGASHCLDIPIPDGIAPLDWTAWAVLREIAFGWTKEQLAELGLAGSPGRPDSADVEL